MTTIGIIGASGTLGRVAVKSLLGANEDLQIRALVRRDDPDLAAISRCSLDTGGLFNLDALDALCERCDVVVNFAARNPEGQEKDLENLDSFLLTNSLGGPAVARAAARHNTPLIHFSTVAVYDTGEYREGDYLTETEALPSGDAEAASYFNESVDTVVSLLEAYSDPSQDVVEQWRAHCSLHPYPQQAPVYGLTKLIGEQAVARLSDNVCCLRMSDVYGPGHESRGVITHHLAILKDEASITADLDSRATASFIFIDDVIRFISVLAARMTAGEETPDIVNLVGPCLDEDQLCSELNSLADSVGLTRSISAVVDRSGKLDRRYSTELFDASFPECPATLADQGLRETWEVSFGK